nr:hypothetical protein CFP56_76422 [Quercus suber]
MEGTEITGVNGPREANRVTVSIDSEVSFEAQLEEIDNDLARFETLGGSVEEGLASMHPLGLNGPGQMG